MRFLKYTFPGLLILIFAAAASAQFGMRSGPPQLRGVFHPEVGQGAAYDVQNADGKKMSMEISVVGKESAEGKDGYWLETDLPGSPQGEMVMKSLLVQDSGNLQVARIIMQMPGRPPMEFPSQMMRAHDQPHPADVRTESEDVGSESITVPAGTFVCEHYRTKDGASDVWVNEKVRPYGLVKSQDKNSTVVLTRVITDAKDKITGTPVPFNPMMMGQRPEQ